MNTCSAGTCNGSQLMRTGKLMKAGSPASARDFYIWAVGTRTPADISVKKGKG
jgi:hypothetical protein